MGRPGDAHDLSPFHFSISIRQEFGAEDLWAMVPEGHARFAGELCDRICADYGVVIVKQGYIFPELKELGALCVMSLTDGATLQDTRRLPFKRIMRPMFPVDDI